MSEPSAPSVGIDLGTTNSVLAFADGDDAAPAVLPVPQLVAADTVESRNALPSFCLLSAVADEVSDFTIAGNGTSQVVLTLDDGTGRNTIEVNGANGAAVTIEASDFIFY